MIDSTKSSMSKFRKGNPRIDYYPFGAALDAIVRLRAKHPQCSRREIVDMLVVEGASKFFPDSKPVSGNSQEPTK